MKHKCCIQRVLPAVYDDALSYYDMLCKLKSKLNEVIASLNSLERDLPAYVRAAIEEVLDGWEERMEAKFAEQDKRIADVEAEIDEAVDGMQERLDDAIRDMEVQINQRLNTLYLILTSGIASNKAYIDAAIAKLKAEFPELSNVWVVSPVDGTLTTIQIALNDMYNTLRYGALTAAQYDALMLTAKQYDDKGLTAFRYDMYGLLELWHYLDVHTMHTPKTGELKPIPMSVYQIADHAREHGMTADEFDTEASTCAEWDGANVTAYMFDWAILE